MVPGLDGRDARRSTNPPTLFELHECLGRHGFMDLMTAQFRIGDLLKQSRAMRPELFEPVSVNGRELAFELPPESLGERWAQAARRDRDLQMSAPHNRRIKEVAVRRIVNHVAENAATLGLLVDGVIDFHRGRGRDYQEHAFQIGRLERPLRPCERALACRFYHGACSLGRDDSNSRTAIGQAEYLGFADAARSNH
jgi:hypothetical protein